MEGPGLEAALERTEAEAAAALAAARRLQAQATAARKAASTGDLRALRRAIASAEDAVGEVALRVGELADGWPYSEAEEADLFASGAFTRELRAAAGRAGLDLYEHDGVLASYPSLVRLVPNQSQVTIDRRPHRQVRPSRLAEHLRELQAREPRLNEGRFLETLHSAYLLTAAGRGGMVKLRDVYAALTLLPSARADYGVQEFARDVYLLDRSGLTTTRAGRRLRLHPGATGAKDRRALLIVVTREGAEKTYYGVEFT